MKLPQKSISQYQRPFQNTQKKHWKLNIKSFQSIIKRLFNHFSVFCCAQEMSYYFRFLCFFWVFVKQFLDSFKREFVMILLAHSKEYFPFQGFEFINSITLLSPSSCSFAVLIWIFITLTLHLTTLFSSISKNIRPSYINRSQRISWYLLKYYPFCFYYLFI